MAPSSPGFKCSPVAVLIMAISGPTAMPEVPGFSSWYVDGGDEMGMHSVIPYEGRTLAPKTSRISSARLGKSPPAALAIIFSVSLRFSPMNPFSRPVCMIN